MRGVFFLCSCLFVVTMACPFLTADGESSETMYFAVVSNGEHNGFLEMTIIPGKTAGAPTVTKQDMVLKIKSLGKTVEINVHTTRHEDPATGKVLSIDTGMVRGTRSIGSLLDFKEGKVIITPKQGGEVKTLEIDSSVIVDDGVTYPYLIEDLSGAETKSKVYSILDAMRGQVSKRVFTRTGPAKVKLAGRVFDCLVFESTDKTFGVRGKVWVDRSTGRAVRTENSMGVVTYLADEGYKKDFLAGKPLDKVDTIKKTPANAELQPISDVPWKVGETYRYVYSSDEKVQGTENFTVEKIDAGSKGMVISCSNELSMQKTILEFEWTVDQNDRPRQYSCKTRARKVPYTMECAFSGKDVTVKAHRLGHDMNKTIPLPDRCYFVDDNNVGIFAILALAAPKQKGAICEFKAYHPTRVEIVSCRLEVKGAETIKWGGRDVECRRIDMVIDGPMKRETTMWLDAEGRLLRQSEQGGMLVMELANY